jgi:hypothetical protein
MHDAFQQSSLSRLLSLSHISKLRSLYIGRGYDTTPMHLLFGSMGDLGDLLCTPSHVRAGRAKVRGTRAHTRLAGWIRIFVSV